MRSTVLIFIFECSAFGRHFYIAKDCNDWEEDSFPAWAVPKYEADRDKHIFVTEAVNIRIDTNIPKDVNVRSYDENPKLPKKSRCTLCSVRIKLLRISPRIAGGDSGSQSSAPGADAKDPDDALQQRAWPDVGADGNFEENVFVSRNMLPVELILSKQLSIVKSRVRALKAKNASEWKKECKHLLS